MFPLSGSCSASVEEGPEKSGPSHFGHDLLIGAGRRFSFRFTYVTSASVTFTRLPMPSPVWEKTSTETVMDVRPIFTRRV